MRGIDHEIESARMAYDRLRRVLLVGEGHKKRAWRMMVVRVSLARPLCVSTFMNRDPRQCVRIEIVCRCCSEMQRSFPWRPETKGVK